MSDADRPYLAAHAEIQDAAKTEGLALCEAPMAMTIEIAKILTRFEDQIDDEWRHSLIMIGGALLRLGQSLEERDVPGD